MALTVPTHAAAHARHGTTGKGTKKVPENSQESVA
mgnify:CR=1 FL=1